MDWYEELSELGISLDKIQDQYKVLIIPSNIETSDALVNGKGISGRVDTDDSIYLCKLLREQGVLCANSYDLGIESKVSHLRSGQIQLGIIWILDKACLPIVNGIIARIIGEKFVNYWKDKNGNKQKAVVKAEIRVLEGKISTASIEYDGDAQEFLQILEKLQNE